MDKQKYIAEVFGLACSKKAAAELLDFRSWIISTAEFDSISGEPLQTDIDSFCSRTSVYSWDNYAEKINDRFNRICEYVIESLRTVYSSLRIQIKRDHAVLPIHAVREIDSTSIVWLSLRPGRTVREKIAGKNTILSVRRRQSLDTPENRLVKDFIRRLAERLEKRSVFFPEENDKLCSELLPFLRQWLHSENMEEIGAWRNAQPNNTLLHDKHYRKIWRSSKLLHDIDASLMSDLNNIPKIRLTIIFWTILSKAKTIDECRIVQQPVTIQYDEITISPAVTASGISRTKGIWNAGLYIDKYYIEFDFKKTGKKFKIETDGDSLMLNREVILGSMNRATAFLVKILFGITEDTNPGKMREEIADAKTLKIIEDSLFGKIEKPPGEYVVFDICSVRPRFILQGGKQQEMPFRLLRQEWENAGTVDCGNSTAILAHCGTIDIKTVSMNSLFVNIGDNTGSINFASYFVEKIYRHIEEILDGQSKQPALHYLVPDWIDPFALETINRSIHFSWQQAFPLPRSIAAAGAWQSSKKFAVNNGSVFLLIIDDLDEGLCVTPLESIFNKKLADCVPKTGGWSWDRYPSFILPLSNEETRQKLKSKYDGGTVEFMLRFFGTEGLSCEAGKLSIVYNNNWNHISEAIKTAFASRTIISKELLTKIQKLNLNKGKLPVYILPLYDDIKIDDKNIYWLGSAWSLVKGGETAVQWQQMAEKKGLSFWHDHLPELSVEFDRRCFLVKDRRTIPMRGKVEQWIVKDNDDPTKDFMVRLDRGQEFYQFPLYLGSGEKTEHYAAYLKPDMPFDRDIQCSLEMTYTVGEDMPYKLHFLSKTAEAVSLKPLNVTWKHISEDELLDSLEAPGFPPRPNWEELKQRKPLKQTVKNLSTVNLLTETIDKMKRNRMEGRFKFGKLDKNNQYFCWVSIDDFKEHNVFCHSGNFLEESFDVNTMDSGSVVYFDLTKTAQGNSGRNITFTEKYPTSLEKAYYDQIAHQSLVLAKTDVANIWNYGHSLGEADADSEFCQSMYSILQQMDKLLRKKGVPKFILNDLIYFLCCLHSDAPGDLIEENLLPCFKSKDLKFNMGNIGRAIGNADLKWQNTLFQNVLALIFESSNLMSYAFEILAIALWRDNGLVYKIPVDKYEYIASKLFISLKFVIAGIHLESNSDNKFVIQSICRHLEVLLALLRTRTLKNRQVKKLFAPQKEITLEFISLLNDLDKLSKENHINMKSRIDLADKDNNGKKFDIIDVLYIYLSGNTRSRHISVLGVNDNEE